MAGRELTRPAIALAAALAALAIVLAVTLSGSPTVLAGANAIPADEPILEAHGSVGVCQDGELLPAGVTAIRLTLVTTVGPRVALSMLSGGHELAGGSVASGWTGGAVSIPVKPLDRAAAGVRICFSLARPLEGVALGGSSTSPVVAARTFSGAVLPGRFTVEYLHPGASSWWSLGLPVARRIGLGRAPAGTWVALLLLVATAALATGACWLAVRELR